MQNLPICILIVVLVLVGFVLMTRENFSTSGLAISNDYCNKLVDVYYDPTDADAKRRADYRERICGMQRRNTIDMETGNYYTQNGILV